MLELLDIFGFVKVELGAEAELGMEEVTGGCSTTAEVVKLVVCVASTLIPGMLGMVSEDIAVATARQIARIGRV
jgi:hypothetical protein